jgi:Kef-type K+ transport system membrane component KefB/glycine cleavage system regulatory protein
VNTGHVLVDILILLVAAKVAAEVAERLKIPAVLGEIAAGIAIGPSAFGLVKPSEVLHVLAELGVILLLVQVGMETDIRELGRVGRSSMSVAVAGVVAPFVLGWGATSALGHSGTPAIFVGAALTATSVGITARVFGDLRALATTEARIVLGAAVADDVLGLIILTVVSRIATTGSVSVASVSWVIVLAVGFLGIAGAAGTLGAPKLFKMLHGRARSGGTLLALALAFALGFSELASKAQLAPIVGAFLAGLALRRSEPGERIARELVPLGHVFIPVFFLQIGIDADLKAMLRPSVLGLAAILSVIAIIGKVIAGWVAGKGSVDRLLIGIGMIPRGEVGLIFASIGKGIGVLDGDLYAAILFVVLLTTVITPPVLRLRLEAVRKRAALRTTDIVAPDGGWLAIHDDRVDLVGNPPPREALPIALDVALLVRDRQPGADLLAWFAAQEELHAVWDSATRDRLWALVRAGDARSWRFLEVTGMLATALPELADALNRRRTDASQLDPVGALRWPVIERLTELVDADAVDIDGVAVAEFIRLAHPERLLVAALALDATDQGPEATKIGRAMSQRLGLDNEAETEVARLIAEHDTLLAVANRLGRPGERQLLELGTHLPDTETVRALHVLTLALGDLDAKQRAQVQHVVQGLLPIAARDAVAERRAGARSFTERALTLDRIEHAPRSFVLDRSPEDLAAHCELVDPLPPKRSVRVKVQPLDEHRSRIDVVSRDRDRLLTSMARGLAANGLDVISASVATWGDGGVLDSFIVDDAGRRPEASAITEAINLELRQKGRSAAIVSGRVIIDQSVSPWHTICRFEAEDRRGLLADITALFAQHNFIVHAATLRTHDGLAVDEFILSTADGNKLSDADCATIAGFVIPDAQSRDTAFTLESPTGNTALVP